MNNLEIKQRITATLDELNTEELTLVESLLIQVTSYLKIKTSKNNLSELATDNEDPLATLRNSDFIGCFSGESDLAEKSEQIAQEILSSRNIN